MRSSIYQIALAVRPAYHQVIWSHIAFIALYGAPNALLLADGWSQAKVSSTFDKRQIHDIPLSSCQLYVPPKERHTENIMTTLPFTEPSSRIYRVALPPVYLKLH